MKGSLADSDPNRAPRRGGRKIRRYLKRLAKLVACLVLLALIAVAVLWWTRSSFLLPQLERWAIARAAAAGYQVESAGLRLETNALEIRDLRVTRTASSGSGGIELVELNRASLNIQGTLWRVATQGLSALDTVRLDVESIHLRETTTTKSAVSSPTKNKAPVLQFADFPTIQIHVDRARWERRDGFELVVQDIAAELAPRASDLALSASLRFSEAPEQTQISGRVNQERIDLNVACASLPLTPIAGLWRGERFLQGAVTGSIEFGLPFSDPLGFTIQESTISIEGVEAYGFATDSVDALASWDDGTLSLGSLKVRDAHGSVRSEEVHLGIFDSAQAGRVDRPVLLKDAGSVFENLVGDFALESDDLRGWLGTWIAAADFEKFDLKSIRLTGQFEGRESVRIDSAEIVAGLGEASLEEILIRPARIEQELSWDLSLWRQFEIERGAATARVEDLRGLNGNLAGFASLSAFPRGRLGTPRGELALEASIGPREDELRAFSLDLELGRFDWANRVLDVRELELRAGGEILLKGGGVLPLSEPSVASEEGLFEATLTIKDLATHLPPGTLPGLWPGAPDLSGPLQGKVSLAGGAEGSTFDQRSGALRLQSSALNLRFLDANGEPLFIGPTNLDLRVVAHGREARIEELNWADTASTFEVHATGSVPLAPPAGSETGEWNVQADVDVADVSVILAPLSALIGSRLPLRAGKLKGRAVITGPAAEPMLTSSINLEEGILILGAPLPAATQVSAAVEIKDGRLNIKSFQGELGASPFAVTGYIDLPRAGGSPEFALQLKGDNLLFARSRTLRVRGDADLELKGPVHALVATGQIMLRGGRLTAPVEFLDFSKRGASSRSEQARGLQLFSLTEPPLSEMRFGIDVRTAEPFRIENNVAKGAVRPSLRLNGTGEVPLLEGSIFIDPTRVSLPATKLQVQSGRVDFDRNNPFYPTLAINGEARIRGIDIEARVAGRFDAPEIYLSSSPPQPGEDLVYLLLTGQLPESSFASSSRQAAQSLAVYLAQDFVQRWFGGDGDGDGGESFSERIDFQRGQDVSRSGAETLQASFRLERELTRENDALYLTAEKDVYDHVNFGLRLIFRFE